MEEWGAFHHLALGVFGKACETVREEVAFFILWFTPHVSPRLDLSQEPRTQSVFFMWVTRTQVFEPSAAPHVAFQNGMQAYQVPDTYLSPQGFGRGVFW